MLDILGGLLLAIGFGVLLYGWGCILLLAMPF
jgi:hypothetical protein